MKRGAKADDEVLAMLPWMVRDWLSSRARAVLKHEGRSVYRELLDHAWLSPGCALPDNDAVLAALADLPLERWKEMRPLLITLECFEVRPEGLVNVKLYAHWVKARKLRAEKRRAGKKGGQLSGKTRIYAAKQTFDSASSKREADLKPPSPSPSPSISQSTEPASHAREGVRGEAEALRREISALLAREQALSGRPADELLFEASDTGRGSITNLSGCKSVPWMTATRDRLEGMKLRREASERPPARAAPSQAAQRRQQQTNAELIGGMRGDGTVPGFDRRAVDGRVGGAQGEPAGAGDDARAGGPPRKQLPARTGTSDE